MSAQRPVEAGAQVFGLCLSVMMSVGSWSDLSYWQQIYSIYELILVGLATLPCCSDITEQPIVLDFACFFAYC